MLTCQKHECLIRALPESMIRLRGTVNRGGDRAARNDGFASKLCNPAFISPLQ